MHQVQVQVVQLQVLQSFWYGAKRGSRSQLLARAYPTCIQMDTYVQGLGEGFGNALRVVGRVPQLAADEHVFALPLPRAENLLVHLPDLGLVAIFLRTPGRIK